MYIFSKKLIYIFMFILSFKYEIYFMILDTQTFMITCLQFVFFFVNIFYFFFLICIFFLSLFNFITQKEKKIIFFIVINVILIFCFSLWVVDQDLGFSFWEFFDYEFFKVFMIFDYKPSFDLVLIYYINEFYDFFLLALVLNFLFIFSLKSYTFLNFLKKYKKYFYLFYIAIIFYFFLGEGLKEDLSLILFSFFLIEFCFFSLYFFKNLSKKIEF